MWVGKNKREGGRFMAKKKRKDRDTVDIRQDLKININNNRKT